MSGHDRRYFMKLAGGVIGAGAVQAATGTVAAEATQAERTPLRGPYADEAWVEYRSDPGNTVAVEATAFDPDAVEATTFYDGPHISAQPAIVGDTMYIAGGGHVRALDAYDGSIRWTSDDVGASSTPAAAYGRIIATGGNNPVVALDIEDGTLDWERELDGVASTPTVAYDTVYVVSGGTLYALDVTDGSIQWERQPAAENATFRNRAPAASDGQVYAIADPEGGDNELVALDASTGDRRWGDQWHYSSTPAATQAHVAATNGLGEERFRALEAGSGDPVLEGDAITAPALDDEAALTILDWQVEATFFDGREGWELGNFSTGAISQPTIAGDTVYAYVGSDHQEEYRYSLLAIDKYEGEVAWSVDVPASDQGLGVSVVATPEAVYVFDQNTIYVVREQDADGGDGSTGGEDTSTPEETPTPEETSTPQETSTPEDTATPAEPTDTECGCAVDSNHDDSSTAGTGTRTASTTATDEDTVAGGSSTVTADEHEAVDGATQTGETDDAGPGLGVASAIGSLGGIAYVLRRRLGGNEPDGER